MTYFETFVLAFVSLVVKFLFFYHKGHEGSHEGH